jgi:MYXO-CTERM domain-containing protein
MTFSGIDTASAFNNILVDALAENAPFSGYLLKANSNSRGDYNFAFMSSGPKNWGSPIGSEPNAIVDQAPLFVDQAAGNFALQASSPAKDTGGPLTAVAAGDSGSGTTLVVDDAHLFQPGWAGTNADWIAVGSVDNVVQITAIDYASNSITLASAVARSAGDDVWLYKDSRGAVVLVGPAPDRGAFEVGGGGTTDGGVPDSGATGGAGATDGGATDGGGAGGSGAAGAANGGGGSGAESDGGCGCRTAGGRGIEAYGLLWLVALAALRRRRRHL